MPEGDTIHYAANRIRPVLAGHVPDELRTPHPRFGRARWEVRQAVNAGGMATYVRTEYELVSATGTTVQMRVKSETTAPPQPVTNAMLPADAQVQVEKLSGTNAGTTTLHLDGLVPTSETSGTTTSVMSRTMGGQSQQMGVDIKIKMTIAPVKK